MPWALTIAIALSVGVLWLALAFAMALGKVTGHADRRAERWAVALAAVPRESSTGAPSRRESVGTMRLPVSLHLPKSSGVVVDAQQHAQAIGPNPLVVMAGLPPKPRGGAPVRVAFCIDFPEPRTRR
jgi:hypothetical protein